MSCCGLGFFRKSYNLVISLNIDLANFHLDTIKNYMVVNSDNNFEIELFLNIYNNDLERLTKIKKELQDQVENSTIQSPQSADERIDSLIKTTLKTTLLGPDVTTCVEVNGVVRRKPLEIISF